MTKEETRYICDSAKLTLYMGCNSNETVIRSVYDSQMDDVLCLTYTQKEELYQIILRIMCSDKKAREQEKAIIQETKTFLKTLDNKK